MKKRKIRIRVCPYCKFWREVSDFKYDRPKSICSDCIEKMSTARRLTREQKKYHLPLDIYMEVFKQIEDFGLRATAERIGVPKSTLWNLKKRFESGKLLYS